MGWKERVQEAAGVVEEKPAVRRNAQPQRFEYDVFELREKLLDGRGSAPTDKLRDVLNDRAREGWQLRHLVNAEVAGMVGKREGWMVIFERPV